MIFKDESESSFYFCHLKGVENQMGKKISNRCFRDPTAEAVFRKEGLWKKEVEDDRNGDGDSKVIVIREEKLNRIKYSPFYSTETISCILKSPIGT